MKRFTWLIAFWCAVALSCKKENDKDWLVVDVQVNDALNGDPVSGCRVSLCYAQYTALGSFFEEPVDLGSTDENGYLHIEWQRPRKSDNFRILLYPPGKYAAPYNYPESYCSATGGISVTPKKLNVINETFMPYARFRFHYINQLCYDQFDSIRLNATMTGGTSSDEHYTDVVYGCADSIQPFSQSDQEAFIWTQHPTLVLEKKIYKGGSDTTILETHNLVRDGVIHLIEVAY